MMPSILGIRVDAISYPLAVRQIAAWALDENIQHTVYAANVHMVMEAWDSPVIKEIINSADMVTPDGMPLVWMLRLKGYRKQKRVYGPTLMLSVLEMAAQESIPVGFYGGDPSAVVMLVNRMISTYPGLNVVYFYSPPFRALSPSEDEDIVDQIRQSGLKILFVGLGCPKQERWIAEHRSRLNTVMVGVGAAFDFHAGSKAQAPFWIQNAGLEWLFRLIVEPRRLWRRYLLNNPRFIFLSILDLFGLLR